jgi:hypothetical protein
MKGMVKGEPMAMSDKSDSHEQEQQQNKDADHQK